MDNCSRMQLKNDWKEEKKNKKFFLTFPQSSIVVNESNTCLQQRSFVSELYQPEIFFAFFQIK